MTTTQDELWYEQALAIESGRNGTKNIDHAIMLYQKAARKGHSEAQFTLGIFSMEGAVIEKDEEEAVYWWTKSAKAGHKQAQYNLGLCYFNGIGTDADPDAGLNLMLLAADQGHIKAQFYLGREYYSGKNIPRDFKRAAHFTNLAAIQGHPAAQADLGLMYSFGQGTGRADLIQAYAWLKCALLQGYQAAQKPINVIKKELKMSRENIRKADLIAIDLSKKYAKAW